MVNATNESLQPNDRIKIEQTSYLKKAKEEHGVYVSFTEWKKIMARLKKCAAPSQVFDSAGWSCVSAALALVLTSIAFGFTVDFVKPIENGTKAQIPAIIIMAIMIVSGTLLIPLGIGFLKFSKYKKQFQQELVQVILEDMKILGDKYMPSKETEQARNEALESAGFLEDISNAPKEDDLLRTDS